MLAKRFGFLKYPQTLADFDEQKGVEFAEGYIDGTSVDKIVVYANGIQVDTRSSTDDSKRILNETLIWLGQEAGLIYSQDMIRRWASLSQIAFYSDANFDNISPAVEKLRNAISNVVSDSWGQRFDFGVVGLSLSFDKYVQPVTMANFTIQRRADTSFPEHKYFSEAPLPTDLHTRFLEEFEADVLAASPRIR